MFLSLAWMVGLVQACVAVPTTAPASMVATVSAPTTSRVVVTQPAADPLAKGELSVEVTAWKRRSATIVAAGPRPVRALLTVAVDVVPVQRFLVESGVLPVSDEQASAAEEPLGPDAFEVVLCDVATRRTIRLIDAIEPMTPGVKIVGWRLAGVTLDASSGVVETGQLVGGPAAIIRPVFEKVVEKEPRYRLTADAVAMMKSASRVTCVVRPSDAIRVVRMDRFGRMWFGAERCDKMESLELALATWIGDRKNCRVMVLHDEFALDTDVDRVAMLAKRLGVGQTHVIIMRAERRLMVDSLMIPAHDAGLQQSALATQFSGGVAAWKHAGERNRELLDQIARSVDRQRERAESVRSRVNAWHQSYLGVTGRDLPDEPVTTAPSQEETTSQPVVRPTTQSTSTQPARNIDSGSRYTTGSDVR